jgi:hypothetical protein
MKLSLKGRNIPRNKAGDPSFKYIGGGLPQESRESDFDGQALLEVFTPEEIVELVNRSLYQLEYQSRSHSKYREQKQNLERPVREMFHSLFPETSWSKATSEQLSEVMRRLKER